LSASSPDTAPLDSGRSRAETILVVDDEESFRKLVVRQLHDAGFRTLEACDGSEAIHIFAEHGEEISAVLLDLVMPTTSGSDALTMLRYYAPTLPVVVTSGYSEIDACSVRQTERGVGFLGKPFTASQLTTELRRVIGERLPNPAHATPPRPQS
jgi:two-component system cell cycle sensor histidine kinase/response regulator CckA